MRRKVATGLLLAASVVAVAVPILAALYLAHRQSMDEESSRALTMAGEVLRRAEAAGDQAIAANRKLKATAGADPCSEDAIARMRDVDMASSYLQAVGAVKGDRLMCSSFGRHGEGIALGPVEYVSGLEARMRSSVDLGLGEGKRFLVAERDGVAVAIHPETVVDVYVDQPEMSFGVVGRDGGRVLSRRGAFDPAAEAGLHETSRDSYFDGRYLVVLRRSAAYDFDAYAAVPVAYLRARLRAFAAVLVPIGMLVAAATGFAFFYLARQQASLPAVLRGALRRREFVLHYQPIVELRTRRTVGAEALLRWPQDDGTSIRPDMFIPAAEDCGVIRQISGYVLEEVAADAVRLLKDWPDGYISINLSSGDLHSHAVVDALRRLLETPGIRPRNLLIEVTEHSFVDPEIARRVIHEIRALGIAVAIDDFGTGFSSLSYLTQLETDYLKIDRVFVETVGTDSVTGKVALHIIHVAQSLGLKVIGEGVETEAQAAFLAEHGVEYAQGWLFARPMPLEELREYVMANALAAAPSGLDERRQVPAA